MFTLILNRQSPLLVAAFLLLQIALCAQNADLNIALRYGYPDVQLQRVAVTEDQTFYLSTNKGLYNYDGNSLKPITIEGLNGKDISALTAFGDSLWIGHDSGELSWIQISNHQLVAQEKISDQAITQLKVIDGNTALISAEGNGLTLLKNKELQQFGLDLLSDNYINDIAVHNGSKIIAVATDRGVDLLELDKDFSNLLLKRQLAPKNDLYRGVCWQEDELLLLGDQIGLGKFDTLWQPYFEKNAGLKVVGGIYSGFGANWIVDSENNLFRLDLKNANREMRRMDTQLVRESIVDLLPLREGYMIAWFENGNYQLIPANQTYYQEVNGKKLAEIPTILATPNNTLWVALEDGLYEFAFDEQSAQLDMINSVRLPQPSSFPIIRLSIWNDYLVAASFGDGLYIFELSTNKLLQHITESDGLDNNSVLDIAMDGRTIWIATLTGVQQLVLGAELNSKTISGSPGYVYDLLIPSKGELYAGSQGESVFYLNNEGLFPLDTLNFPNESIISMVKTKNHGIWGISTNSELFRISEKGMHSHPQNNELSKLAIYELIENNDNQLTLISEHAIYRSDSSLNFLESFWSPNLLNSRYQHVAVVDIAGSVWVATEDGLVRLSGRIFESQNQPAVHLKSVLANHVLASSQQNHQFSPEEVDFTFEISAPWYDPYRPIIHEYRLLGLDSVWRTSNSLEIFYPKLAPRDYIFQHRTSYVNSNSSISQIEHHFSIALPYYKRPWFIILLACILILATFLLVRNIESKQKQKLRAESERVQSQFEVLKNQINPHFLFNSFNTLAAMIGSDPMAAETYTEKLSAYFREILSIQEDDVVTLAKELELAQDFIFLQRSRYGDALKYQVEVERQYLKGKLPVLSLQILLENAIKHNAISKASPLTIKIIANHNGIEVINNLQPKSSPPPSTGVGLTNLSNRLRILFNKELEVTDSNGFFKVTLPHVS